MTYKEAIVDSLKYWIKKEPRMLFVGQSVSYPGHAMFNTLEEANIPMTNRIEVPVLEDSQMGMATGISLAGIPVCSIYPRMDFLIIAMNQLVNHLDKWAEMSHGEFNPKVIIRTMIGSKEPLNPGLQHYQDHTEALRLMCPNIDIYKLRWTDEVLECYRAALASSKSSILIELGDLL